MDEEKFSLERFLELMGERDGEDRSKDRNSDRFREWRSSANFKFAGAEGKMFHVEQSTWTDVREPETIEGRAEVAEKGETNTEKPRDDRRDVLRTRALKADELPQEVEAKPKRAGLLGRVVETVRRVFKWKADEAVAERSESVQRAGKSVVEDTEQVGARVEREWHEDEVPRARGRVWQEEEVESTKRARHWAEDVAEARERHDIRDSRSEANLREIAENDSNFAESRGKIVEFRKSDVSVGVDLRAISRAIERDSRRY